MFQEKFNVAELVLEIKLRLQSESDKEQRAALKALSTEVPELGLFGTLLALHEPFDPNPQIARELYPSLREKLSGALEVEDSDGGELSDLIARFREQHDDAPAGPALRQLFEQVLFEFFELEDHALFAADVTNVVNVLRAVRPGQPVRNLLPPLCNLSRYTAKFVLGCFPGHIDLIGKISDRTATREEIASAFDEFAPRLMQKRLPPILNTLITEEKRFRLCYIIWCRMRGYPVTKGQIEALLPYLPKTKHEPLIDRLLANAGHRRQVLEHLRAIADHTALMEQLFEAEATEPGEPGEPEPEDDADA